MNRLRYLTIPTFFSLLLFFQFSAEAQTSSVDSLLTKELASDELLPILTDSAIKYSPVVRTSANNEAYANANLQISKKSIYNAVSLVSSYNYGTNYSATNNPSGGSIGANFTTAQTGFYNLGVGIRLPLSEILNRKNIIKVGESQVNMAAAEKDNAVLYIKQEVIRLYQDFKLMHRLLSISSQNKQASQVNNTMAEKNFLNAQLTVDQVSGVLEIYNKSVVEYETNLNRFQTSYLQLETYTGVNLSKLIMGAK
jgi:outer membrane protein TolC